MPIRLRPLYENLARLRAQHFDQLYLILQIRRGAFAGAAELPELFLHIGRKALKSLRQHARGREADDKVFADAVG